MTTIHTRARVDPDGNITIPVGAAEAGTEVEVTVAASSEPGMINGLPRDKWFEILKSTEGSIPNFELLHEAVIEPIPRFDDE